MHEIRPRLPRAALHRRGRPRLARVRPGVAAGIALVLAGAVGLASSAAASAPVVSVGHVPAQDVGHWPARTGGPAPVALAIPSIGVRAVVVGVGRTRSGELDVPSSYTKVGWWRHGPGLGVRGPVVLVGHVDDHNGPAVFYRLRQLRPGAAISVSDRFGKTINYRVDAVRQYPDDHFPSEQVYGHTARPTLRLLTCGGYNWLLRHYSDNIVVYAHQQDS